jgi:preprotein translocase subunit SecD
LYSATQRDSTNAFHSNAASAVVFCVWGQAPALSADKPAVRLEFRRAHTKPAKDLEEATVPKTGEKIYLHKTAEVNNEDIAEASIDEEDKSDPHLKLKFTKQGQRKMEKLTTDHIDKPLAVLVDGKVLAAPIIRSTVSEQAVLSGIGRAELERIVKGLKAK